MIELRGVSYTYSPGTVYEKKAVRDISLTIGDGEFLAVIGHTGSGKSTLIQLLNGLLIPTAGTVLFNGEDIRGEKYDRRALRTKVGLVFQYPENQLFEETVLGDVCYGPKNKGLSEEEAKEKAREALLTVGIEESLFDMSPFDLSGGQKRRVAIAGVLAMEPEVLILDEPTAGLDPKGRDDILGKARALHRERGMTVILVSHSMEDVARFADRILVIEGGELAMDGTPKEIFARTEELEKMGLRSPQVTYIMRELVRRGFPVPENTVTTEEAAREILKLYRERTGQ